MVVVKQSVLPDYTFNITAGDMAMSASAKNIPWEYYTLNNQDANPLGYVMVGLAFNTGFEMTMIAMGQEQKTTVAKLNFFVEEADVKRLEELLKIVSGKK